MMFLAPVFLTTALTFGTPGAVTCPAPQNEPTIRVDVDVTQPSIDHNTTREALKTFQIATVSPYGDGLNVHVNGLMRGAITIDTQMQLSWQKNQDESINCSWFDSVNVTLRLKPTIYVASEIPTESCMYREVLNHEYKHYQTDFNISKDYQVIFQDEIEHLIKQTGVIGPYSHEQAENVKNDLSDRLDKLIKGLNDRMKDERIKRQSLIDTREEYERVARACAGQAGSM